MSVICLGETLIDLLADQLGLPLEAVSSWSPYPGGAPANVASGLVKLGTPTALITCLGVDTVGDDLVELLTKIEVDLTGLQRHPTAPTRQVYVTRSQSGDRNFSGFGGLNTCEFADAYLAADRVDESLFQQAKFLVIGTLGCACHDSKLATEYAIALAKKYGLHILLDINWRPMFWADIEAAKETIYQLMQQADSIKMSDEEAEWLFNSIDPQVIHDRVPHTQGILITAGEKGCYYYLGGNRGFLPAFAVNAIDTTGAGDSFVAAFLHQLNRRGIKGMEDGKIAREIVLYACAAGALTTLKPGAIDAQPQESEILEFLAANSSLE
jgi:fructokinase